MGSIMTGSKHMTFAHNQAVISAEREEKGGGYFFKTLAAGFPLFA